MKLVLLRHGQSEWNKLNLFTGWKDVDLSEKGVEEAKSAGRKLKEAGIEFDIAYTSYLKRAIKTLNIALEEMDSLYIETVKTWRLNERHYGALQGLNKKETAEKYGDEQVHIWRRSFDIAPPLMDKDDENSAHRDKKYRDFPQDVIPDGESLKLTLERTLPFFMDEIGPSLIAGKNVLVAAHGNSLRSITKYIENISDEEITSVEIATGEPIVYTLDENLKIIKKEIL
ncbi:MULTISPECIES: 2,3-diphosphoglycerate-dependent phosphoglycerate mutase [Peptoniphilus]|uniref:2,3-bisphosphoglycerate-dependent phosphoglycerate mutase n=1 Tax=Peptoniphilus duerdenii ATCC BAA-1640 TaxID=862517 RepID=E0NLY3_9FIRM|nr:MULTISPECIES: 2,3-diphosphoglycerate-dependent phosphoglycerate mutase [Peptoniphilus]EFM25194.1 phosphoglycerate mutase 1 family [Peptoniphilus duerdenii ATCC BAA-1640]ERT62823.1 phosphoglycerate mutase 1 family [Peptoniphilus sp. BV3AC2]MDK8275828.1 2,3-diphosphoglycerate-dependent phosphoglycerate mutase [Peptoniphilus duerdenii]